MTERYIDNQKKEKHMTYHLTQINGENATIIKPVILQEEGKILDDFVERYKITDNLYGEIYRCNIIDTFLLSTKKLPYAYISIIYEKSIIRSFIYTLYLQFRIEDEMKTGNELINNKIKGKFTIEIVGNKEMKILEELFMENEKSLNKVIERMKLLTITKEMINIANEEIDIRYKELYENNEDYDAILEKLKD